MGTQRHRNKVGAEKQIKRIHKECRTWKRIRDKRRRLRNHGFKNIRSSRIRLIIRVTEQMNVRHMMKAWECKTVKEYRTLLYGENYRKTFNKWGD